LTPYFSDEVVDRKLKVLWERWTRCAMGFKPSPYQAVQGMLIADEEIRGDHLNPVNIIPDAALAQLGHSVHKRPHLTHLVLIPRLMTSRWRKLLGKICDLVFTLPVGTSAWGLTHYEPLIVGLCLPLCSHRPWKLRGTPMLARLERQLRDVPQTAPEWGRHFLREFLLQARALDRMSSGMVRGLLHTDGSERVSRS